MRFWPLAAWWGIQLGALAVALGPIPLSRGDPRPMDLIAVETLLVAQVLGASLLFPMVFVNVRTAAVVIASTPPLLELAALVGGTNPPGFRWAEAGLVVYLLLLAMANRGLLTRRWRSLGVMAVGGWALMGPLLAMASINQGRDGPLSDWTPIGAMLNQLESPKPLWPLGLATGVLALLAGMASKRLRSGRAAR